jgi:glycosyltransferase involved in cell wall biosynthesis
MPQADVFVAGPRAGDPWRVAVAVGKEVARRLNGTDAVHVHGLLNPVSSLAARSAISRRVPVILGPFGMLSRYTFNHRLRLVKRAYFRMIDAPNLRRASAIHFTTGAERDEAAWHGIDFGSRAYVVPPPYRMARSSSGPRQVDRNADDETVLFLGRLVPKKGVELLLEAWRQVHARRPQARLVVAGSGTPSYEARLRASAQRSSDIAGSVDFTGFVSGAAKERRLADADLFVLPSHHENFGVAVLEAVAAGLPAVVTPAVQLAPWIESQGLGVVAERTAGALAAAIVGALDNAALRARVANSGFDAVAAAYQPKVIAPLLDAMYRGACIAPAGGGGR